LAARPLTSEEFSGLLEKILKNKPVSVAVGVSGGPDSMALAKLLGLWAKKNDVMLHALTVDHGLRRESAKEAQQVGKILKSWSLRHEILRWKGKKPKTRLMEEARAARYALIADYCQANKIKHLFLAHHQDDQAETFLFRLAKGSGLDGLAAMKKTQVLSASLTALRPLLEIPKEQLVATCKKHKIAYIKDPSNETERFARPRLRKSWKILEEEGLSSKRLAVTAARLERARAGLDEIAGKAFIKNAITKETARIAFKKKLLTEPEEIAFRVLLQAIRYLRTEESYLPRMERIEQLFGDLRSSQPFRKRTLGGLVFERNDKKGVLIISLEKQR
jgi:tRNA(Ile)-lysidine synthase